MAKRKSGAKKTTSKKKSAVKAKGAKKTRTGKKSVAAKPAATRKKAKKKAKTAAKKTTRPTAGVKKSTAKPKAKKSSVRSKPAKTAVKPKKVVRKKRPARAVEATPALQASVSHSHEPMTLARRFQFPPSISNDSFLPQYFGGTGLTECFSKLDVATIGELKGKSEQNLLDACGMADLVKIKARIERIQDDELSEVIDRMNDEQRPVTERFAYYYKGHGERASMADHVCEIIHRPDPNHVTVRLGANQPSESQDVTIPLEHLELVSRQDRRKTLEALTSGELDDLHETYDLKTEPKDNSVDRILNFEFRRDEW